MRRIFLFYDDKTIGISDVNRIGIAFGVSKQDEIIPVYQNSEEIGDGRIFNLDSLGIVMCLMASEAKGDVEPSKVVSDVTEFLEQATEDEVLKEMGRGLDYKTIHQIFRQAISDVKREIGRHAEIERRRKALKSGDENQRINAMPALAELGDTDSIPDLMDILQNGASSKLRGHAAYALGRLDAYEAIPALRKGLEDEDDFVQRQCARALRRLGEEVPEMPKESFMRFAHQMDGPMQAIRSDVGYLLELLKEEGKIDKGEQEQLEAIDTHATRLGVMLDNLTYANLAEDMQHEEYLFSKNSISALLQRAARQFKFVAQYRGIDIRIDDSIDKLPPIEFDRDAIFTVFVNLIDNAVKFSYPNNVVDIAGRTDNHSISITISDFGIGISEEERDKIFNLYYRGRKGNAARYTSGSGLGLFVIKKIIKEHGGEIFVSSKSKGDDSDVHRVVFTVELPAKVGDTNGENTVYRK